MVLLTAACTSAQPAPTASPQLSDAPAITTLPAPTTTSTTTTTPATTLLPPASSLLPAEGLAGDIDALIELTEELRGLGFLTKPGVVLMEAAAFASSVGAARSINASPGRDAARTEVFQLVELLDPSQDFGTLRADIIDTPEHAWYDPTSGLLLVAVDPQGFGPVARSEIVHEIVHAITDQHYRWWDARESLVDASADDRLAALDALIEGDATYFQIVYVQGLPEAERDEIAREFAVVSPAAGVADRWVLEDLAFSFDAGFDFAAQLVAGGGIAAVDRAYLDPPQSTEHVLHPERYRRGEAPADVGVLEADVEFHTALPSASLGEWNIRLLLATTLSPGLLTQTADGWGGDSYRVYVTDDGQAAIAFLYLGDSEDHTIELTQAFIDLAEDVLRLGSGERSGGGEVYARSGRPWMFIDREDAGLLVVLASTRSAGQKLQDQLSPPVPRG